jgi:aspartate 1-decarboxylase
MIMRWVMRSKLHNGRVKDANVAYVGSIEIDEDLVEAVGLWVGEKVLVVSNDSGARLETYVIAGKRGSGIISINGAAARLIGKGEQVIVMGFELTKEPIKPTVVLLDDENRIVRYLEGEQNERA